MVTSAWWVESHQVSKTAPTGEYLSVGSFMVRGKKNFLPPSQLELGLAVLFKLGDEDSIARHVNERRDFILMDFCEGEKRDYQGDEKNVSFDERVPEVASTRIEEIKPKAQPASNKNGESQTEEKSNENYSWLSDEENLAKSREVLTEDYENIKAKSLTGISFVDKGENESCNISNQPRKKGMSVRERKLVKKYGSLEEAQTAIAEREKLEEARKNASKTPAIVSKPQSSQSYMQQKRGKKGKLKKAAKKYSDQDDEDRELALLALHGGEKKRKSTGSVVTKIVSESQEKAAAQTKALLIKDAIEIAETLSDEAKALLADCVTVTAASGEERKIIRWNKYDADVLEKFKTLTLSEQQMAASRLLHLKNSFRIDNFSSSLAGIIRTIKRYGGLNSLSEHEEVSGTRRKTKTEKEKEKIEWKGILTAEGIAHEEIDIDEIDDTTTLGKLTGKPDIKDSLLHAVPICAPYQTLSQYKYRVKLVPGNQKRGKAARQCVDFFLRSDQEKTPEAERIRDLIKRVNDNDWVKVICSDVKISSSGAYNKTKSQKSSKKN